MKRVLRNIADKIKKEIKKIKSKYDYKEQVKELKKLNGKLLEENIEKDKRIDELEFKLDQDFQAQKIEQLEAVLDGYRRSKHQLRAEIKELKERLKEK